MKLESPHGLSGRSGGRTVTIRPAAGFGPPHWPSAAMLQSNDLRFGGHLYMRNVYTPWCGLVAQCSMMVLKSNNRARPGRGDMETIVHRCARCLPACIAGGTARTTDCDTASTAGSIARQRGAGWPAAWPRITPRPPWQATSPQHGPGWQGRGGRQADLPRLLRWLADQDAVPPSDTPSS